MKKWLTQAAILASVLFLLGMLFLLTKPSQQVAQNTLATQTQESNKPSMIKSNYKPDGDYLLPDLVPIAKDYDSFDLLITAILNKDVEALASLERQGNVFVTNGTTRIKYIKDVDNTSFGINKPVGLIQVSSGKHIGKTGFVFANQIK